jgi:hypothetical protein
VRLIVSDPTAIPALVGALRDGDCLADQEGADSVAVAFPWLRHAHDARQARMELAFFARAWEAANPGLRVRVAAGR